MSIYIRFNPLNAELNPICHLLALLGAHYIFHVSGLRDYLIFSYNGNISNSRLESLQVF